MTTVPFDHILSAVAQHYGVEVVTLQGRLQRKSLREAREVVYVLADRLSKLDRMAICRMFNGRDHSCLFHALDRYKQRAESDPVCEAVDVIEGRLTGELFNDLQEQCG